MSSPDILTMFSGEFVRFRYLGGRPAGSVPGRWDRILAHVGTKRYLRLGYLLLAHVGTKRYPSLSRSKSSKRSARQKAAGRSSRFIAQGLCSGASPKKWGFLLTLFGRGSSIGSGNARNWERRE